MNVDEWIVKYSKEIAIAENDHKRFKKFNEAFFGLGAIIFVCGLSLAAIDVVPWFLWLTLVGVFFATGSYFGRQSALAFQRLGNGGSMVLRLYPHLNALEECSSIEAFSISVGLARALSFHPELSDYPTLPKFEMTEATTKYLQAAGLQVQIDNYARKAAEDA